MEERYILSTAKDIVDNCDLETLFTDVFLATGLPAQYIEKDYWVTKFLRTLQKNEPRIIFKGGTCLSKCHKAIERFSEDIDVSYSSRQGPYAEKPTQGERKRFKEAVVKTAEDLGLTILNIDDARSKRLFNRYIISYPHAYAKNPSLEENLIVETAMQTPTFPVVTKDVGSYIADYLYSIGKDAQVEELGVEPFPISTITLERTYVDKVFAICDYFLCDKTERNSRHIYDLYKLDPMIDKDELPELIDKVREFRRKSSTCYSAQPGMDISEILDRIVDTGFYRDDYKNITMELLYENGYNPSYDEIIAAVEKIRDEGLFVDTQNLYQEADEEQEEDDIEQCRQ